MQRKLIKPIFKIIISILGFSLLTFWLLSIAPGDPAAILIRQKGMIPEQALLESTREALGLNQPFIVRYGIWLSHLLQGNLGQSFITNQSVLHELSLRMHPTLILIGHAWLFSIVIATICGLYSGARPNSLIGRTIYWLSSLGLNIPIYWLSILMMYVFGVLLKWLPIMNNQTWQAYLLPIIALTISEVLSMTLYIHSLLKQSNQQPYMQAIQTRGIKQRYIWFYYYFRSILFPLLILFTQGLIHLFGHVVLVENVFSIPGIGRYLLEAMGRRDIPVIQGITLIIGIVIFILFGIIDGLNQLIDPRSRFKREEQILDEET